MTSERDAAGKYTGTPTTFDPALLPRMRELWEDHQDMPSRLIADEIGVTKNTVIGHANRKGWAPRKDVHEPTTLPQRMDALHAMMDRVLAENPPGKGRVAE